MPPEPSGRIGRYRPRKSSCASAGEDTLGVYCRGRRIPSPTGDPGRFALMDPRDDDIQFDFFEDEPATTESAVAARRACRAAAAAAPGCGGPPAGRRTA